MKYIPKKIRKNNDTENAKILEKSLNNNEITCTIACDGNKVSVVKIISKEKDSKAKIFDPLTLFLDEKSREKLNKFMVNQGRVLARFLFAKMSHKSHIGMLLEFERLFESVTVDLKKLEKE